jgi:hypothetical protein
MTQFIGAICGLSAEELGKSCKFAECAAVVLMMPAL